MGLRRTVSDIIGDIGLKLQVLLLPDFNNPIEGVNFGILEP